MPFKYLEAKNLCFENYTLILPAIAVGNVGQLAIDLLLGNLGVEFVADIHHACLLPIVGANPFDPKNLKITTGCEMYENKEHKLVIIQHRAPIVKSREKQYLDQLLSFIKRHKFKTTVMLSSCFSQFFTYEQLQSVPLHYLCTQNFSDEKEFAELKWQKFSLLLPHTSTLPGAGISNSFYDICEKFDVSATLLISICSEGNNYPEAHQMVSNLNAWLKIKEVNYKWQEPFSWKHPYANNAPQEIY